jgi:hypothetical protein
VLHSLSTSESYVFDTKRPVRTVALEPDFVRRSTRAFVCGGLAGALVLHEKGWLGHKETVLHQPDGSPVYTARWRGRLLAWATDAGAHVYDTQAQAKVALVERPAGAPRADLFRCTLHWQDDATLLIGWADHIKVARVRARPRGTGTQSAPPLAVEVTAVFQLDCMIAGLVPHPVAPRGVTLAAAALPDSALHKEGGGVVPAPNAFLVLAYSPPDRSLLAGDERADDGGRGARKSAERPELRIVSRGGEELTADALGVAGFEAWGCNDYVLCAVDEVDVDQAGGGRCYVVLSPKDLVVVRPRDRRDHVAWLVERRRYEEALEEVSGMAEAEMGEVGLVEIGQKYIEHLVGEGMFIRFGDDSYSLPNLASAGDYVKAAHLCPKVCAQDAKRWDDWIFVFAQKHQLQVSHFLRNVYV